jgi:hypothetical protein
VLADQGQAEAEFQRAAREYKQGDYAAAATDFEQAFRDDPRASVAYNAGLARQLAGQPAQAADDYAQALALRDLPTAQASDAQARLQALEVSLGNVHVAASGLGARINVGHRSNLPSPAFVHVAPGTYDVNVTWPDGRAATRTVSVPSGVVVELSLDPPAPAAGAEVAPEAPHPSSPVVEAENPSDGSRRTVWVDIIGGIGIAGLATGTVFGALAMSAAHTVDGNCNVGGVATQCRTADAAATGNRGETYATVSTIGFVAGGVGVATAFVLWLTRPRRAGVAWSFTPAPLIADERPRGAVITLGTILE